MYLGGYWKGLGGLKLLERNQTTLDVRCLNMCLERDKNVKPPTDVTNYPPMHIYNPCETKNMSVKMYWWNFIKITRKWT